MAIKKTGDAQPILECYGDDGNVQKCPECGNILVVIAMDEDNKLVCEHCDMES